MQNERNYQLRRMLVSVTMLVPCTRRLDYDLAYAVCCTLSSNMLFGSLYSAQLAKQGIAALASYLQMRVYISLSQKFSKGTL